MPIRTKNCQHVFCKSCFQAAVRSQGPQCPMCRGSVKEREPRAADVQKKMRENKGKCRACGQEKFLNRMRFHYRTCRKYIEEYGPICEPPPVAPVQPPAQSDRGSLPNVVLPSASDSVQRLYCCPYCPLADLSDILLVNHCLREHFLDLRPAVCPICSSMPWGDPNYHSRNLINHLRLRHRVSYSQFMDEDEEEDVLFCLAIHNSVQDF